MSQPNQAANAAWNQEEPMDTDRMAEAVNDAQFADGGEQAVIPNGDLPVGTWRLTPSGEVEHVAG